MNTILMQLRNSGLIPIATINNADDARPLAQALLKAQLKVLEITFRTEAAEEVIRLLTAGFPEMIIGGGTILTIEQAEKAIRAGVQFILTPGFNPKIVDYCLEKNITIIPGVNAPAQIELALEKGLSVLKFFPAEQSGGIELIKAIGAPFPDIQFIATGGISNVNLALYFSWKRISACGGSWIAHPNTIALQKWDEITKQAEQAIRIMLGFSIVSLEIAGASDAEINAAGPLFSRLFCGSSLSDTNDLRVMETLLFRPKGNPPNDNCLCFRTPDIKRALFYIKGLGFSIEECKNENCFGQCILSGRIAGFQIKIIEQ
jgi:2-dehydro-3-deoxyphosphogluconate aldolase/(4S)-4-hydroxy-2-oxoglutarate aldolase